MYLKTYQWSFLQSKVPLNNEYWKNCQSVPPVFSQNRQKHLTELIVLMCCAELRTEASSFSAMHLLVYASLTSMSSPLDGSRQGPVQVNADSTSRNAPISFTAPYPDSTSRNAPISFTAPYPEPRSLKNLPTQNPRISRSLTREAVEGVAAEGRTGALVLEAGRAGQSRGWRLAWADRRGWTWKGDGWRDLSWVVLKVKS